MTAPGPQHDDPIYRDGDRVELAADGPAGASFAYMANQILVQAESETRAKGVLRARAGIEAQAIPGRSRSVARLRIPGATDVPALARLLTGEGLVASPNHVATWAYHTSYVGTGLPEPATSDVTHDTPPAEDGPVIVLVDSGIAESSSISDRVNPIGDAVDPLASPAGRAFGHGTFVAGLALAACPHANVWMVRPDGGSDDLLGLVTDADLADAIDRALDHLARVDVLNISAGGYTHDGLSFLATSQSISRAVRRGITVVAAAGNDGRRGQPFYPAAEPGVVAVGSIDPTGATSCFSNQGEWVDLVAVGEAVVSTFAATSVDYPAFPAGGSAGCPELAASDAKTENFTGHASWSGTSFAAARVAGALAGARR